METQETIEGTQEVEQTLPNEVETGPADEVQEEEVTLPSDDTFEIPEKFKGKSAEEIARAYVELERLKQKDTPEPQQEEGQTEEPEEEEPTTNKYLEEFYAKGELSEESYNELLEQGYTKEDIDEALDYEKYKLEKQTKEMADVVGGVENYAAMEQWATEFYPEEERAEFVKEFTQAGKLAKQAMLRDLYNQYQANTTGGDVVHTNEPQRVRQGGYTSQHELQKDMSDPRYGTDRSYTKMVEEKLARSKVDW